MLGCCDRAVLNRGAPALMKAVVDASEHPASIAIHPHPTDLLTRTGSRTAARSFPSLLCSPILCVSVSVSITRD